MSQPQPAEPGQPVPAAEEAPRPLPAPADPSAAEGTSAPEGAPGPGETSGPEDAGPDPSGPDPSGPDLSRPDPSGPDPAGPGQLVGVVPAAAAAPARRAAGRTVALVVGVAVVALVAGLIGGFAGGWAYQQARQNTLRDTSVTLPAPARGSVSRPADSLPGVAARMLPSVVAIKVQGNSEEGTGSGFIIDRAGYILTNNHVVEAASGGGVITVVFQDGTHTGAKIVGRDPSYDLAVVKTEVGDRAALPLGDSDAVVVGDTVIAIGAPLGLQGTVTTGIVSALNRPVAAGGGQTQAFINAIQTDAAINPGNSGGPLVNAGGQVIGINSAIARTPGGTQTTAGNIGVGFAIPSNQARRTAQELIRTGRSEHPVIGVLLDRTYSGQGVKVRNDLADGQPPVTPGGPADKAGIRPGDLIIAFNGRPVTDPDELVVAIRAMTPGDVVTLTVRRGGSDREVRVTLQASAQ